MHVTVTKIDNGYLVTNIADDGSVVGTKAILKNIVGSVPCRAIGLAVTRSLGKIGVAKRARKTRTPKAAATVAG